MTMMYAAILVSNKPRNSSSIRRTWKTLDTLVNHINRESLYDKVIVSNRKPLVSKYGNDGFDKIENALAKLVAADDNRGIRSKILYLDDKRSMKQMHARPVMKALDPRENKQAIDAVFKFSNPHYLMILGAPDVVPHQDIDNPAYRPDDDSDAQAWGDLPYACEAPYSRDPSRFVGPTRVVGRLPDLVGAKEPSYLLSLLNTDWL